MSAVLSRPLLAASSDLLIVLEPDGVHYLAQQTLTTESELVLLKLPSEREVMLTLFSGPEKITFLTAHELNPDTLSLWSGAVTTRYRHGYDDGMTKQEDGSLKLSLSSADFHVSSDSPSKLQHSVTWLLPEGATLISFNDKHENPEMMGSWIADKNTISYDQTGGILADLTLHFALYAEEPEVIIDPCTAVVTLSDECSPDTDQDNVPDYRDVCITEVINTDLPEKPNEDKLGCGSQPTVILKGINFESGKSYLNAASRALLDRLAIALQRTPAQFFEIAAHTDNAGTNSHNQRLSENRSAAVRHYLMLRGVGPNQLVAAGYGELSPITSNDTSTGRQSNRRIELKRLN